MTTAVAVAHLDANIAGFETNMRRASQTADKFADEFARNVKRAGAEAEASVIRAGNAIAKGFAFAAAGVAAGIGVAINDMAKIAEAAQRVGASASGLNDLKFAVEQSGGSVQALEAGFRKLSQQMANAAAGGKAAEIFKQIGVSATAANGELKKTDQVFLELANRFKGYKDGAAEVALATQLFGRSGTQLLGTLNAGADGVAKFTQEFHALGGAITDSGAAAADQFQDNIAQLQVAVKGVAITLANDLLPTLLAATQAAIDFAKELRASGAIDTFAAGLKGLLSILDEIAAFFIGRALVGGILAVGAAFTSAGAAATLFATVMGGLRGVLVLLGGPAGVIALVGLALYELATAEESAADAAKAHKRAIDEVNSVAAVSKTNAIEVAAQYRDTALASLDAAKALLTQREAVLQLALAEEQRMQNAPREVRGAFQLSTGRAQSELEATKKMIGELDKQVDSLNGKMAELAVAEGFDNLAKGAQRAAPTIATVTTKTGELKDALSDLRDLEKKYFGEQLKAEEIRIRQRQERDKARGQLQEMERLLKLEALAAGLSADEARKLENAERALGLAREFANAAALDGLGDVNERTEEFRRRAEATFNNADKMREFVRIAERTADDWRGIWDNAANGLGDSITTALFDGAGKGADQIKDVMKNLAKDLVRFWLQQKIVIPLQSALMGQGGQGGGFLSMLGNLFGGGGAAGAAGGAQGGGFLSWLGGLFGGGGAAGAAGSTTGGAAGAGGGLTSGIGAIPVAGWIAMAIMLNQSLFKDGWSARPGSLTLPNGREVTGGGLQTNPSMIIGGTAAFASNALNRIFGSLGLSDSTSSLLSGTAVMNRLFGRKAPRLTNASANFDFSGNAVGGSQTFRTLEEGGVFRSDRRRSFTDPLSGDVLKQAQELFDALRRVMTDAARALRSEAPAGFEAAFREVQEFDKKGKVKATKFFVDVLGRTWEEATKELAITRLNAEALIQTIDAAFGDVAATVGDTIGENVAKPILDGLGEIGGLIGDKGRATMTKALESLGQASAIAERWRDDAEELLAGAQFLLLAATDIRKGAGLLGEDGTLGEITDLVEDLAKGGEELAQAYARIFAQTELVRQAFDDFTATFEGTRTALVEFSDELADAAGGLDRLGSLFSDAFAAVFTEAEQLQIRFEQARANRDREFADVDLDPNATAAQVRDLVRAALAGGNAEFIVQALEAARAFGELSEVLEQLGLTAEQAANAAAVAAQAFGGTGTKPGLGFAATPFMPDIAGIQELLGALRMEDLLAGLTEVERQTRAVNEAFDAYVAQAIAMGATTEQLAELEALRASSLNRVTQSLDEVTAAVTSAGMAAVEAAGAQLQAAQAAADLAEQIAQQQRDLLGGIQQFLDGQRFSDTSTLTPQQQLAEAQRQFDVGLLAAQAGDLDALGNITGLAERLLTEGRDFFGSSQDFTDIEAGVRGQLEALITAGVVPRPDATEEIAANTAETARELALLRAEVASLSAINERMLGVGQDGNSEFVRLRDAILQRAT